MTRTLPALALLMLATPALAQTNGAPTQNSDGTLSMHISYEDLDLTQAPGRAALERRLAGAVRVVCPELPVREVQYRVAAHKCRTATTIAAREQRNEAVRRSAAQVLVGSR